MAVAALVGAALFFSSEYSTHRFLFHARPSKTSWLLKLQHRLHYDHHIDPPKLDLLFLPWWFVIPTALVYFASISPSRAARLVSLSLVFGSLLGLAFYEWVHYVAHVPFVPKTPVGRYMKKYHLWHHFKNEHSVVRRHESERWTTLMQSYRAVDTAERSTTVREVWRDPSADRFESVPENRRLHLSIAVPARDKSLRGKIRTARTPPPVRRRCAPRADLLARRATSRIRAAIPACAFALIALQPRDEVFPKPGRRPMLDRKRCAGRRRFVLGTVPLHQRVAKGERRRQAVTAFADLAPCSGRASHANSASHSKWPARKRNVPPSTVPPGVKTTPSSFIRISLPAR